MLSARQLSPLPIRLRSPLSSPQLPKAQISAGVCCRLQEPWPSMSCSSYNRAVAGRPAAARSPSTMAGIRLSAQTCRAIFRNASRSKPVPVPLASAARGRWGSASKQRDCLATMSQQHRHPSICRFTWIVDGRARLVAHLHPDTTHSGQMPHGGEHPAAQHLAIARSEGQMMGLPPTHHLHYPERGGGGVLAEHRHHRTAHACRLHFNSLHPGRCQGRPPLRLKDGGGLGRHHPLGQPAAEGHRRRHTLLPLRGEQTRTGQLRPMADAMGAAGRNASLTCPPTSSSVAVKTAPRLSTSITAPHVPTDSMPSGAPAPDDSSHSAAAA